MLRVLRPITVADANIVSHSETEAEYGAWSSATSYVVGNRVIYQHAVYEALLNGTNKVPTAASSATYWLLIGPSNYWAVFDGAVSTQTVAAGAALAITLQSATEIVQAVGLVNAYGSTARVRMLSGADVLYDQTQTINQGASTSFYDYFFGERNTAGNLLFSDLPPVLGASIEVTVNASDAARCGVISIGRLYDVGGVEYGADAGIIDYSRKTTDTFGTTTLRVGDYARRCTFAVQVPVADFRRVNDLFTAIRATPCFFVGDEDTDTLGPLSLYGWPRSFRQVVAFPTLTTMALEIEGIT